jgi:hypothetical protein
MLGEVVTRRGDSAEGTRLFDGAAAILRPLPLQPEDDFQIAYAALADHYQAIHQASEADRFRRLVRRRPSVAHPTGDRK